jgi:hypothetical protein
MGIIVKDAGAGRIGKSGATASAVSKSLAGLKNPRLNTAFYRLINKLPDHPLTLKQARMVNVGKLLVPPSPSLDPGSTEFFAVQSDSKKTGYCGQFLYGIGGEIGGTFYDDAIECIIVVLLQDSDQRSFQYMLGVNGRNVYKSRSTKMVKHWRAKRGWFRGWEDKWVLGDGGLADHNIVKWTVNSELSVKQANVRVSMKPEIEGNLATCSILVERVEAS